MSEGRHKKQVVPWSESEYAQLRDDAKAAGVSMNHYVRAAVHAYRSKPGVQSTTPQYAALASQVDLLAHSHAVVENALRLAGMDDAINQAQALLAKEDK